MAKTKAEDLEKFREFSTERSVRVMLSGWVPAGHPQVGVHDDVAALQSHHSEHKLESLSTPTIVSQTVALGPTISTVLPSWNAQFPD